MSAVAPTSDADLLDLLRSSGSLGVPEMAHAIEVTPTAIRQRLTRLMAQGLIQREAIRSGRGRPRHRYQLTQKGHRLAGTNFTDLALALWREIGAIPDLEERRVLLERVVRALASGYAREIQGKTTAERMRSLSLLLSERRVPFSVQASSNPEGSPMLVAHACPYPELAEEDRQICDLEKTLFAELLGRDIELTQCRLDGGACCQFQPT
ncbi:MAG: ArsR family transcriptional regulator [Thermoguttaceae bacterium]|jgi:predicted ArsR family transcriptional regulator